MVEAETAKLMTALSIECIRNTTTTTTTSYVRMYACMCVSKILFWSLRQNVDDSTTIDKKKEAEEDNYKRKWR